MRKVKQGLALLLTLLMLVGCLPMAVFAAEADYSASYRIERTNAAQYSGQDVAEFSFAVSADNKQVGNANSIVVAYDTSVFKLLNRNKTEQSVTTSSFSKNIGNAVAVSAYVDEEFNEFTRMAYARLSDDGTLGYLACFR